MSTDHTHPTTTDEACAACSACASYFFVEIHRTVKSFLSSTNLNLSLVLNHFQHFLIQFNEFEAGYKTIVAFLVCSAVLLFLVYRSSPSRRLRKKREALVFQIYSMYLLIFLFI